MYKGRYFAIATALFLALLPLFFYRNEYLLHILILSFIWAVVASAWDLIMGYANIVSLGQLAFFAVGGYTTAMLSLELGTSPWLGILAGGGLAAMVGIAIGLPCLRLKGIYVAVVTLALHLVLPTLIRRGADYGTGGGYGLARIPPLRVDGYTFTPHELVPWYYVAFGIFILLLYMIYRIIHSSSGLAFIALRDAESFAKSLGINEYKYKLIVFGVSAFITGLMGALYTHYIGIIGPTVLNLDLFLIVLVMVIFGGIGRFPGAAIGAFAITFLNELLRPAGTFRLLILGAIIVCTIILMPKGLMGISDSLNRRVRRNPGKAETVG